jgi:hypothetical protein
MFIKYESPPAELDPPAPTTTVYELPGVTDMLFAYPSPPPPPPYPLKGDISPAPPPPPPTATTETLVTPEGATHE